MSKGFPKNPRNGLSRLTFHVIHPFHIKKKAQLFTEPQYYYYFIIIIILLLLY